MSEASEVRWNPRTVSATKLISTVDCDIVLIEIRAALESIADQLQDQAILADAEWVRDIHRAQKELHTKMDVVLLKRNDIVERMKTKTRSPEEKFGTRFVKAAKDTLPHETYTLLFDIASHKEDAE